MLVKKGLSLIGRKSDQLRVKFELVMQSSDLKISGRDFQSFLEEERGRRRRRGRQQLNNNKKIGMDCTSQKAERALEWRR